MVRHLSRRHHDNEASDPLARARQLVVPVRLSATVHAASAPEPRSSVSTAFTDSTTSVCYARSTRAKLQAAEAKSTRRSRYFVSDAFAEDGVAGFQRREQMYHEMPVRLSTLRFQSG